MSKYLFIYCELVKKTGVVDLIYLRNILTEIDIPDDKYITGEYVDSKLNIEKICDDNYKILNKLSDVIHENGKYIMNSKGEVFITLIYIINKYKKYKNIDNAKIILKLKSPKRK